MLRAGQSRRRMAMKLNAAYGDGLLSHSTLTYRLELLFGSAVIEPSRLIGDLTIRPARRRSLPTALGRGLAAARRLRDKGLSRPDPPPPLLALDWSGACDELILGRSESCDVVLEDITVSRRHARLSFRDGNWVVCDLESSNGTKVNGTGVVRCRLLPGDRVTFGSETLVVD